MSVADAPAPRLPWYRYPWVWFVLAIPAAAVTMGAVLLVLSVRGYDGLVADDYYKRGMQVNRSLERDRAAASHGITGAVSLAGDGTTVRVTLAGEGGFTAPPQLDLVLSHATRAGLDRTVRLSARGPDAYGGPWTPLEAGTWNVTLGTDAWRIVGRYRAGPEPAGEGVVLRLAPAPL